MKWRFKLSIILFWAMLSFANMSHAQNSKGNSVREEIAQLRNQIIQTIKNEDWAALIKLTDSCKDISYEKNIFLWREEKSILLLLSDFWPDALKEKWSISDVAYYATDKKNKPKLVSKRRFMVDSLNFLLRNAFAKRYPSIINKITADSSLTTEDKSFLFTKVAAFNILASSNKKEPLKTLDKNLLAFKKEFPQSQYKESINYFKRISKVLKMGAFFGGGFSIGKFNNGIQNIFTTPVNYHLNFDLYNNRVVGMFLTV